LSLSVAFLAYHAGIPPRHPRPLLSCQLLYFCWSRMRCLSNLLSGAFVPEIVLSISFEFPVLPCLFRVMVN